jgi:hypothetical protein
LKQKISILLILLFFIVGCSNQNSLTESEYKGEFVVESYSVVDSVKINPINDSLWTYISFDLKYQFRVWPGTINRFTIAAINYSGMSLNLDYAYPDSVNKFYKWSYGYWLHDSLEGIDSITVITNISGAFWNPENTEPRFLGEYKWEDQRRIQVNH